MSDGLRHDHETAGSPTPPGRQPAPYADLDATSSEPLHPAARETLIAALDRGYADPRRLHRDGRAARMLLDNAREVTAEVLGVRPDEVSFTTSGTDAVHRGLLGLHRGAARLGTGAVATAVEHSAVRHALAWADAPTVTLPVDRAGRVVLASAPEAIGQAAHPPVLAAVQAANHEVGTLQPVGEVADTLGIPVFVDACASMGRLPLPEGWSVAAGSAHKWGGPAGVGVLVVRKGVRWRSPFPGDDRTDPRMSGFDNVPAALAGAAALQAMAAERIELNARHHRLIARLRTRLPEVVPDVEVAGAAEDRLPHLITFSCLYVDGEALVVELDRLGFGVASGSACAASTLTPSHVLEAMGVLTHGNVRVSLHRETSEADVDRLLEVLPGVVAELRSRVGM